MTLELSLVLSCVILLSVENVTWNFSLVDAVLLRVHWQCTQCYVRIQDQGWVRYWLLLSGLFCEFYLCLDCISGVYVKFVSLCSFVVIVSFALNRSQLCLRSYSGLICVPGLTARRFTSGVLHSLFGLHSWDMLIQFVFLVACLVVLWLQFQLIL